MLVQWLSVCYRRNCILCRTRSTAFFQNKHAIFDWFFTASRRCPILLSVGQTFQSYRLPNATANRIAYSPIMAFGLWGLVEAFYRMSMTATTRLFIRPFFSISFTFFGFLSTGINYGIYISCFTRSQLFPL